MRWTRKLFLSRVRPSTGSISPGQSVTVEIHVSGQKEVMLAVSDAPTDMNELVGGQPEQGQIPGDCGLARPGGHSCSATR